MWVLKIMLGPVPVAIEMKKLIGAEWEDLPTGAVVATANLVGCHEIGRLDKYEAEHELANVPQETGCWDCNRRGTWIAATDLEVSFGDWTPGRYAWEFSDMKIIVPVPVRGRQGLWDWRET